MRLYGRSYVKSIFTRVVPVLLVCLCQTTLFAGISPGTYRVIIKADTIEVGEDTWVFSTDGKFESEGLGIESEWDNTGVNSFSIKTDEQEIKDTIEKNFIMIGLNSSDFSILIKKVEISGTAKGDTIKGDIKTNFSIKINSPIKTSFKVNGGTNFQGERIQ